MLNRLHCSIPLVRRLIFASCALSLVSLFLSRADETPARSEEDFITRMRGVFDVELPKTISPEKVRFDVRPGISRSHGSLPFLMRVGVNANTEAYAGFDDYLNFHHVDSKGRLGLMLFRVGGKYRFKTFLKRFVDTAVGMDAVFPLSRPPLEYTDGRVHYVPYITFSKPLSWEKGMSVFLSIRADLQAHSYTPGSKGDNATRLNSDGFTTGWVYDRFPFRYAFTLGYSTTAFLNRDEKIQNYFSAEPGVIYELPERFTPKNTGKWLVGLGLKERIGTDGHSNLGVSGKLRVELDFKRWRYWFRSTPAQIAAMKARQSPVDTSESRVKG